MISAAAFIELAPKGVNETRLAPGASELNIGRSRRGILLLRDGALDALTSSYELYRFNRKAGSQGLEPASSE